MLPFSEACERNKEPILQVLREAFSNARTALEIGSGTGQHADYFSTQIPNLIWQPSDFGEYLPGLRARVAGLAQTNILEPIVLDVLASWPDKYFDAIYSSNTLHIMSWSAVEKLFAGAGEVMAEHGVLAVYGPFKYAGQYTSDSNAEFDLWLRERDPASGIRDFEAVNRLADGQGLELVEDHAMPANNQCIVWRKSSE